MLNPEDVCAVIVTRGDVDLSRIIETLPYGELVIWDNSREADMGVFGRYHAASTLTKKPVVYFQDDDLIFRDHDALLAAYEPGKIVSNMDRAWIDSCGYHDLALVGAGSLVDRNLWVEHFERYERAYDDGLMRQQCDFIFGTLAPFKRVDLGYEVLPVASEPNRLWRQEGQMAAKWEAISKARRLRRTGLVLMVKDEAKMIADAIKSAAPFVDGVVLVDTGSTDGTDKAASDACFDCSLPLEVFDSEWRSFGENRQESIEVARSCGYDYLLLMDGDETLEGGERIAEPWRDAYYLRYAGSVSYAHPRMIRACLPWRFTPGVHSTLVMDGEPNIEVLSAPQVVHHGTTRHGSEKLERDVELLWQRIREDEHDARAVFHLAKALEGLGRFDEALDVYHRRVQMGGFEEEVFYSAYRLGVLKCSQWSIGEGIEDLLSAWEMRPFRAEPLRAIAAACNEIADGIPFPEGEILLVHRDDYVATQPEGGQSA